VESDETIIEIGEITASSPLAPLLKREGKTEKGEKINIETYNDHRIAMCFGFLETYIRNLNILNPDCVSKTYPNFWEDLEKMKE
jgi:5-enolpyruvylshikimate-3-phosphate synthase